MSWSNSLNILTPWPFAIGVKKNADGARLQDLVPADVYARWTTLKTKYIGADSGIETDRPIFAAQELFGKALAIRARQRSRCHRKHPRNGQEHGYQIHADSDLDSG